MIAVMVFGSFDEAFYALLHIRTDVRGGPPGFICFLQTRQGIQPVTLHRLIVNTFVQGLHVVPIPRRWETGADMRVWVEPCISEAKAMQPLKAMIIDRLSHLMPAAYDGSLWLRQWRLG